MFIKFIFKLFKKDSNKISPISNKITLTEINSLESSDSRSLFIETRFSFAESGLILIQAIENLQYGLIENLLKQKVDVNFVHPDNQLSPLILAADKNCSFIVKSLLMNGANPKWQNKFGATALHFAARNLNSNIAKYILSKYEKGVFKKTIDNKLPIHWALSSVKKDLLENNKSFGNYKVTIDHYYIVKFLIDKMINIYASSKTILDTPPANVVRKLQTIIFKFDNEENFTSNHLNEKSIRYSYKFFLDSLKLYLPKKVEEVIKYSITHNNQLVGIRSFEAFAYEDENDHKVLGLENIEKYQN